MDLGIVNNIHDSREEVKILILERVWKKLIPTHMDNFKAFKISVEVIADMIKITEELELEAEPDIVTELLESQDKILLKSEQKCIMNVFISFIFTKY